MLAVLATLTPTASAGSPSPKEVTDTGKAKAMREEASGRFTAQGVDTAGSELHVWELAEGDYLIGEFLPASLTYDRDEFSFDVTAGPGDPLEGLVASADATLFTAAAAYWSKKSSGCFARVDNGHGYLDSCYRIYKEINDGNGNREYYALYHWATCGPLRSSVAMFDCWLHGQRNGGSAMAWEDWDPRSDLNRNCGSITIGVEHVAILSFSHELCEIWDITKSAEAGRFENRWSCGCLFPFGVYGDREVAYMVEVSVSQPGSVVWTLSAGFTAV
jgi:hypothetical protein